MLTASFIVDAAQVVGAIFAGLALIYAVREFRRDAKGPTVVAREESSPQKTDRDGYGWVVGVSVENLSSSIAHNVRLGLKTSQGRAVWKTTLDALAENSRRPETTRAFSLCVPKEMRLDATQAGRARTWWCRYEDSRRRRWETTTTSAASAARRPRRIRRWNPLRPLYGWRRRAEIVSCEELLDV